MPDANLSMTSTTKARSQLARLHMGNSNPDPDLLQLRLANLACAKIDKKIRDSLAVDGAKLGPAHVAHLVGLLLLQSGVGGETVGLVERLAREAVENVQATDDAQGGE